MVDLGNDWDELLKDEFNKDYYLALRKFLKYEYTHYNIYPPMQDIFNALRYTAYRDVRAVIIGQDPYHGAGQAQGLCFSVRRGVPVPPSLQNIYREAHDDVGIAIPSHGSLVSWAASGVLLLNTVLTVRESSPMSHKDRGWEQFTDRVITLLDQRQQPLVFLLWGAQAKNKEALITNQRHLVLKAAHPSPLSASGGFFGCRHFSRANQFLAQYGSVIDWRIAD